MFKGNNSEFYPSKYLSKKKKAINKIYISKSKSDLRTNSTYSIDNKNKITKIPLNLCKNQYNTIINQDTNSTTEISLKMKNNPIDIFLRKKSLNIDQPKKISKLKSYINNKKPKTSLFLYYKGNNKALNIKNEKRKSGEFTSFNEKIFHDINNKNKSKNIKENKIFFEKSQKNLRGRNYVQNNNYNQQSRSFDSLNLNIICVNNRKIKQNNLNIKVNRILNVKNIERNNKSRINNNKFYNNEINENINTNLYSVNDNKTLENDSSKIEGGIKKQKPKEYNIFLDKEYQERFVKKTKVIKDKYDKLNSDKQRKYNTILVKKKSYNIYNFPPTTSSISTSNSSHNCNKDWVYRLYNEEMNKKKLENKIINSIRKSILTKVKSIKIKNEDKIKENSKFDKYGNYKNYKTENNYLNNLLLIKRKNKKSKKNLCLNIEINNDKGKKEENKLKLNKNLKNSKRKKKKQFNLCNDELINEEDEEKEIDREENNKLTQYNNI